MRGESCVQKRRVMPHRQSHMQVVSNLCAFLALLQCCHGLEYEVFDNGTSPQAIYRKENSSITVFEDLGYADLVSDWLTSQNGGIIPGRIDTHHHYIPEFYAQYLEKYSTWPLPVEYNATTTAVIHHFFISVCSKRR